MPHSWWWLVVDALAVFRLTVLVVHDDISKPAQRWLFMPFTPAGGRPFTGGRAWLVKLVSCPWCVSVWIAAGVVVLTRFAPEIWVYPAFGLALAGAAGPLADRSGH